MRADNECPVDLGDLHIRMIDDFGLLNGRKPSVVKDQPVECTVIEPVNLASTSSCNKIFYDDNEQFLTFSDDFESCCQPCLSVVNIHDDLIHQTADNAFHTNGYYCDRSQHSTAILPTSAYVSPDVSRPCTPNGSPFLSQSPVCFGKSGSMSASPEYSNMLSTYFATKDSDHPQRRESRGSVDSGPEKKEPKVPRHKRPSHIRAETKRRGKIQDCFSHLAHLVPMVVDNDPKTAGGLSRKTKAVVLRHTADYCRRLCVENKSLQSEADVLRAEMQALTDDINSCHSQLPAEGIIQKVLIKKDISIDEMFRNYLNARSLANWRFWIFGQFLRPLFDSFNRVVSTSSAEDFLRTVSVWSYEHLSLIALRPVIFKALFDIGKSPSVIKADQILPHEIQNAVLVDSGLVSPNCTASASVSSR